MTYNAANRKDIRAAEKAAVLISIIDREVIQGLMSVANGRQWINDRLAEAQVFADPFSPDPLIHAYNAGKRASGMKLFNDIMLFCPNQFQLMIREAYERSTATERRREPNADGGDQESGHAPDGDFDPGTEGPAAG